MKFFFCLPSPSKCTGADASKSKRRVKTEKHLTDIMLRINDFRTVSHSFLTALACSLYIARERRWHPFETKRGGLARGYRWSKGRQGRNFLPLPFLNTFAFLNFAFSQTDILQGN